MTLTPRSSKPRAVPPAPLPQARCVYCGTETPQWPTCDEHRDLRALDQEWFDLRASRDWVRENFTTAQIAEYGGYLEAVA